MKFIDQTQISIASGKGGPGCSSFLKEKYNPRGGPDGGDGGKGGDIIFHVNPSLNSLVDFNFRRKYAAPNGQPGEGRNRTGKSGADLVLQVPLGTLIKTGDDKILEDLNIAHQDYRVLIGGRGGKGNTYFKNSVNQAPTHSQPGEPGQELDITLELKLMADVGLVGFPNAGKSTLISCLSHAKPKVADYPFTTLVPSLGVVRLEQAKSFVLADIPGIIKGAHKGKGLGTQFLKHIERTKCFIHLIDISPFSGRDPLQDYQDINYELKMHDELHGERSDFIPLSNRPQLVVLNKIDSIKPGEQEEIEHRFREKDVKFVSISAFAKHGLDQLKYRVFEMVEGKEENV